MRILRYQGLDVRGITEGEFVRQLESLPLSDRLTLVVRGPIVPKEFVISISRLVNVRPGANNPTGSPSFSAQTLDLPSTLPPKSGSSSPASATDTVAADPSGETARQHLAEIRRAIDSDMARIFAQARAEMQRARSEGRTATGSAQPNPVIFEEGRRLVEAAAKSNLAIVCEAAAAVQSALEDKPNAATSMCLRVLVDGINQRRDYLANQKETVLKYLPKLPNLIATVDHMHWLDGAYDAVAAGWKHASHDESDGMLTFNSSRYAVIAARCGVTDALVALARTIRKSNASKRMNGILLEQESAALKALTPFDSNNPIELADFVLKNKSKLVFDFEKSLYKITQ